MFPVAAGAPCGWVLVGVAMVCSVAGASLISSPMSVMAGAAMMTAVGAVGSLAAVDSGDWRGGTTAW